MSENNLDMMRQNCFFDAVTSLGSSVKNGCTDGLLNTYNDNNLIVYQTGYINRLITVACESIFERPYYLIGDAFKTILWQFFYDKPPSSLMLDDSAEGLCAYIDEYVDTAAFPYMQDICHLSYAYWHLMRTSDPCPTTDFTQPDALFLVANHFYIASQFPLFDLWVASDPDADFSSDVKIVNGSQDVLGYKKSAYECHIQVIDPTVVDLVNYLTLGYSLTDAITHSCETVCAEEVQNLVAMIARSGGFELRSSN